MNTVEFLKSILKERHIPMSRIERDLGFANGYIGQLRKGTFPYDRLVKIADYLEVSPDYLASCGAASASVPLDPELTDAESELLSGFRQLSDEDRDAVLRTIKGLLASSSYIKTKIPDSVESA